MSTLPTSPGDEALIAAIARGDADAYAQLYDRYAGLMLGVARRLVGDGAEDLVHDVFVEAWHKAHTYRAERASVRTWLLVRLRSRALDRLRSAGHTRTVSLDDLRRPERTSPAHEAPDLAADRNRVRKALAGLSDIQREVLELTYFRGLTSSEIAEHVGIPVGTVKSRARAAYQALRSALGVGEVTG